MTARKFFTVGFLLLAGCGPAADAPDTASPGIDLRQSAGMRVAGDVMAIARDLKAGGGVRTPIMSYCSDQVADLPIKAMSEIVSHYYLRFTTLDQPGVLAKIAGILGQHDISIQSMIQPESHAPDSVPIVLMTHEAKESNVTQALAEIDKLDIIQEPTRLIRVENELD